MKKQYGILWLVGVFSACSPQAPSTTQNTAPQHAAAVKQETNTAQPAAQMKAQAASKPTYLVDNPTPLPEGYVVDRTYLKQPLIIDANGDGHPDAFRVLKNPNAKGLQYLFEFRLGNSKDVYYYQNDSHDYDLNVFNKFEPTERGENFVDMSKLDGADIVPFEEAPKEARLILKNEGVEASTADATCAASLFYLKEKTIQRVYLC
ncbi:hypothetical protein [Acinetobacter soli]|uniref:Lipoprotein n=1 Tax=Acinetobacter soli TaxID=487316 RepID=A0AB38YZV3_9GAMM|nr:hypothetical protein [Acinetobacter soli]KQD02786.1 hypothetical protein APD01_00605 [Acinetobacter soli]MDQ8942462.1 hypothetical protein [Acinetobacter soli]WND07000.1 hypothetical protein RHP80_07710 [Acinetobacter soli]